MCSGGDDDDARGGEDGYDEGPCHGYDHNCHLFLEMESVLELEGGWLSLRCEEETPAIFPICQKY